MDIKVMGKEGDLGRRGNKSQGKEVMKTTGN